MFVFCTRCLRRFQGDEGLTLVEVFVALFVLSVAVLGVAGAIGNSLSVMRTSRERQDATREATRALEEARALDFRALAVASTQKAEVVADAEYVSSSGCASGVCFSPDGTAVEDVIFAASGGITDYRTDEVSGRIDVRRFVTWASENPPRRRVTVVATFADAGGVTRTVRESTIVAEAKRGLPVPQFDLSPRAIVTTTNTHGVACFTHLLRNIGAEDRYDWKLHKASKNADGSYSLGDPGSVTSAHSLKAQGWTGEAWLEDSDYQDLDFDGREDDPNTASSDLWTDITSDQRPDSPASVGTSEVRPVSFCYHRNADPEGGRVFGVVVRSAFDSTVQAVVFHEVVPTDTGQTLYLHHDPPNDGNAPDVCAAATDRALTATYEMNATIPQQVCADSVVDTLYDYDRNLDPDSLGGLWLKRNDTAHQGVWDWQLTQDRTFSSVEVIFSSAWKGAFVGSSETPTLSYEVVIEAIDTVAGTTTPMGSTILSYTHIPLGWATVSTGAIPIDPAASTVLADSFLRVRIRCTSPGDDCHMAYDTNSHRSTVVATYASTS